MSDRLAFLGQFIKQPLEVASITPSSRFVARRVARCVGDARGTIVEIGAGTGGITRAILDKLADDARLLAVELSPTLAERVRWIADPRLVVHCGSAENLPAILHEHGCAPAATIVCGLPFSMTSQLRAVRILRAIDRSLASGGELVAYQLRSTLGCTIGPRPEAIEETIESVNIPPLRISRWRKAAPAPAKTWLATRAGSGQYSSCSAWPVSNSSPRT